VDDSIDAKFWKLLVSPVYPLRRYEQAIIGNWLFDPTVPSYRRFTASREGSDPTQAGER